MLSHFSQTKLNRLHMLRKFEAQPVARNKLSRDMGMINVLSPISPGAPGDCRPRTGGLWCAQHYRDRKSREGPGVGAVFWSVDHRPPIRRSAGQGCGDVHAGEVFSVELVQLPGRKGPFATTYLPQLVTNIKPRTGKMDFIIMRASSIFRGRTRVPTLLSM